MVSKTPQSIGKRIAQLRQQHGFTQQTLAERAAISRVAVSHIEADLSIPGERTVALLAGLFKCAPHELVAGTTYPQAKAERLPYTVAWYTALELDLALLENDLEWVGMKDEQRIAYFVLRKWEERLARWGDECLAGREREMVARAWGRLREVCEKG